MTHDEASNTIQQQSRKLEHFSSTIRECIALLQISGENTKQAVIDKLRGLGE